MALLDLFKKKPKKPKEETKSLKVSEVKAPEEKKVAERSTPVRKAGVQDLAWRVLKRPHVTEKATALVEENQYTFDIWPRANKVEVKRAVESVYGVDVVSIKIIQGRRKLRRRGRIEGWKRGDKKAIVKLREGQKIEILPR